MNSIAALTFSIGDLYIRLDLPTALKEALPQPVVQKRTRKSRKRKAKKS